MITLFCLELSHRLNHMVVSELPIPHTYPSACADVYLPDSRRDCRHGLLHKAFKCGHAQAFMQGNIYYYFTVNGFPCISPLPCD